MSTNEVKPYLFLNYPLHIFRPDEGLLAEYDEINESLVLIEDGKIEIIPIFDPISTKNIIRYRTPDSKKPALQENQPKQEKVLPLQCKLNRTNKRLIGILMNENTLLILRDKKTICMLRYPLKKKVKKVIDFFWITKEHLVVVTSRTVEVYALGKKFRELKTFTFQHTISFCRFHPKCRIFVVSFENPKASHVIQPFKIGEKALMKLNRLTLPNKRFEPFKKSEIEIAWLYNIPFLVILQSKRQEADLYRLRNDNFEIMRKYNLFSPGEFYISVVDSILIFHHTYNKYSLLFDVFAEQPDPVAPPMSIAQYQAFHKKTEKLDQDGEKDEEKKNEEEEVEGEMDDLPPVEEPETDVENNEALEESEEVEEKIDEEEKALETEKETENIDGDVIESSLEQEVMEKKKRRRSQSVFVEPTEEVLLYDSTWRYFTPNLILSPSSGTFHELQLSLLDIPLTIRDRDERIKFLFRRKNSKFLLKNALKELLMIVHHSFHELTKIFKIVNQFYYQSIVTGRIKNISLIHFPRHIDVRESQSLVQDGKGIRTGIHTVGRNREFGLRESDDQIGDPSLIGRGSVQSLLPSENEGTRIVCQLGLPVIEQEDMLNLVLIPMLEETKKEDNFEESKYSKMKKITLDKMSLIVLEYIRSLINHRIPIQPKLQNFFVDILIDLKRYESLRQYIKYKLVRESTSVALKLISISKEYPQAFDLALQMLVREKEYGRISQVFLDRGEILKVMHLIEKYCLWEHIVFRKYEMENSKDGGEDEEEVFDDLVIVNENKNEKKKVYDIVNSIPLPAYVLKVARDFDEKMVLFYHAYQKIGKIFKDRKIPFPYDDQTRDFENLYHIVFGKVREINTDLEDLLNRM